MSKYQCHRCRPCLGNVFTCVCVKGWLISIKVHFGLSLFWVVPCISDRNLTLVKDRSFPKPQNPPLVHRSAVPDLIWLFEWQFGLNWSVAWLLHNFERPMLESLQFVPISFVSVHTSACLIPVEYISLTIVLKHAEALNCCQCLISYPNIWITF